MAEPYRRRTRVVRNSRLRLGNPRPGVLDGGEDAPLSPRGRFEFRVVIAVLMAVGVLAVVVVELTRH